MTITLPITSPYSQKDRYKTRGCNKFIGRGSANSATHAYALAFGDKANCGDYSCEDTIFVSAEGNRSGRLDPDFNELLAACLAGATFHTDNPYNRKRGYNVGERQVAKFLAAQSYKETVVGVYSVWRKGEEE